MTRPAGWVAGDVIATVDDPRRGQFLTVWGSAYRYPVLHAAREAAAAEESQRGQCVAHVTEHPMPGTIGQCYVVTLGTLGDRAAYDTTEPADSDGRPVTDTRVTRLGVLEPRVLTGSATAAEVTEYRSLAAAHETGMCVRLGISDISQLQPGTSAWLRAFGTR